MILISERGKQFNLMSLNCSGPEGLLNSSIFKITPNNIVLIMARHKQLIRLSIPPLPSLLSDALFPPIGDIC